MYEWCDNWNSWSFGDHVLHLPKWIQCGLIKPITSSLSSQTTQSVNNNPWRHWKGLQTSQLNKCLDIFWKCPIGTKLHTAEKIQRKLKWPLCNHPIAQLTVWTYIERQVNQRTCTGRQVNPRKLPQIFFVAQRVCSMFQKSSSSAKKPQNLSPTISCMSAHIHAQYNCCKSALLLWKYAVYFKSQTVMNLCKKKPMKTFFRCILHECTHKNTSAKVSTTADLLCYMSSMQHTS